MEVTQTKKYTIAGDPIIEEKVSEIVRGITNEIVTRFHPKSIILIGSFGRGEVTATINEERLEFLSDCDIVVISNRYISRKAAKKLSSELTQMTGLEVGISGIELSIFFMFAKMFPQIWKPSIDNYEMKYGSRILYGEDYLDKIPDFKPEDIPVWEGIRLTLNRMIESLEGFSLDYLYTNPSKEEEQKLLSGMNKIILSCQDALLLSIKRYHHLYQTRNKIFQEVFPVHFKELSKEIPQLLTLASQATNYKLKPDDLHPDNILELWFDAVGICDTVFRYIISRDMGITFSTYPIFQEKYIRHPYIKKKYYRGLTPFPPYQNLRSAVKMVVCTGRLPRLKSLSKFLAPWTHIVHSTIPIIYFSLSRYGTVDELSLVRARENVSILKKLEPVNRDIFREWDYIRQQVADLRDTVCY